MDAAQLPEVVAAQLELARSASSGRSAHTIHGGRERRLRQVVMALAAGHGLDAHDSPPEATLQVLAGHVRLDTGHDVWEGTTGDFVVIPDERHDLKALADSAIILTVLTNR